MLRTGQSPAPSTGRSSSASTPGSRPTPGVLLPGTLASPRTGLAPAGCRELVARLRRRSLPSVTSAPELLDAHSDGITDRTGWRDRRRHAAVLAARPDGQLTGRHTAAHRPDSWPAPRVRRPDRCGLVLATGRLG